MSEILKIKLLPGEEFKEVNGYDGYYEISNMGRIISWKSSNPKILKTPGKYNKVVSFWIEGIRKMFHVNTLVWDHFGNIERNRNHSFAVIHKNGNYSDNRIINLEYMSARKVTYNGYINKSTSKFIGIYKRKDCNRWEAKIKVDGKSIYLGIFKKEEKAAEAYQNALAKIQAQSKGDSNVCTY